MYRIFDIPYYTVLLNKKNYQKILNENNMHTAEFSLEFFRDDDTIENDACAATLCLGNIINKQNSPVKCFKSPHTPHPSSPECVINHLDTDCNNDFCPYFIGVQIREPLSVLSNFSGYSTPQANTPLPCCASDVVTPHGRKKSIRKDKGNIRRRHMSEWIDVKRKTLKNLARNLKAADKRDALSSSGKIISATFDFQKVLNTPYGEISVFYYKRKLNTMNFTVYNLAAKAATCYMWHEAEGKRGSNEVSSCLSDFISKGVDAGAVEFRFWSDNCAGQNRNRIVFAAYMLLSQKYNITIKHTFLEQGHTQQEGDSVHALIERCAKNKCIYSPLEWFPLVRWAKEDGKPYTVVELNHTHFLDFKSTLSSKNWTKSLGGDIVQWTKIKEVKVLPSEPMKLHFNSGIIPAVHHNFYQNLLVDSPNLNAETDSE
ncbi:hypothetical protein ACJJTC_015055 [Scirpophaga incertulas]